MFRNSCNMGEKATNARKLSNTPRSLRFKSYFPLPTTITPLYCLPPTATTTPIMANPFANATQDPMHQNSSKRGGEQYVSMHDPVKQKPSSLRPVHVGSWRSYLPVTSLPCDENNLGPDNVTRTSTSPVSNTGEYHGQENVPWDMPRLIHNASPTSASSSFTSDLTQEHSDPWMLSMTTNSAATAWNASISVTEAPFPTGVSSYSTSNWPASFGGLMSGISGPGFGYPSPYPMPQQDAPQGWPQWTLTDNGLKTDRDLIGYQATLANMAAFNAYTGEGSMYGQYPLDYNSKDWRQNTDGGFISPVKLSTIDYDVQTDLTTSSRTSPTLSNSASPTDQETESDSDSFGRPAKRKRPARVSKPRQSVDASKVDRRSRDKLLMQLRNEGLSYREIKDEAGFEEAESTLRGRMRVLSKPKDQRVRKPKWLRPDVLLLQEAVRKLECMPGPNPRSGRPNLTTVQSAEKKIPWTKVANYLRENDSSYPFAPAACSKKWSEISEEFD